MMIAVPVTDDSQVADGAPAGVERRAAPSASATRCAAGSAGIVATELATNLIKHAGGGGLLVGADATARMSICWRSTAARGMADLAACLADGYSTAGTPGNGWARCGG